VRNRAKFGMLNLQFWKQVPKCLDQNYKLKHQAAEFRGDRPTKLGNFVTKQKKTVHLCFKFYAKTLASNTIKNNWSPYLFFSTSRYVVNVIQWPTFGLRAFTKIKLMCFDLHIKYANNANYMHFCKHTLFECNLSDSHTEPLSCSRKKA